MAEWEAEQVVDARRAAGLISARFPRLRGARVEPLAEGWDNTVFRVDGEWVFRFPRREAAVAGVRREIAELPRLAPALPLPVPVPELVGEPGGGYPWPFWGARAIPGRELADAGPAGDARVRAATGLGGFLRALHGAPPPAGLPRDPMRRADPGVRAPLARERLERLARQGLRRPDPAVERVLADGEAAGAPEHAGAVCHGDLHVRHLLVGPDGRATGVIDWGDLCLADPAVDLAIAYAGFAGPARAAFLAAYGPVGPGRELRARVLAVFLSAVLAEYAAATGRRSLLGEALAGLGRAVV